MTLTAPAYAKINLSLRIHHRRADGFHALSTRMAALTLADTLTMRLEGAPGHVSLTCSDPSIPVDAGNLVVQAVTRLAAATGPLPGLAIHLEKRIPHGAGLGGGSSDAAVALRLALQLSERSLSEPEMRALAAQLGSDVPFFLHGGIADCHGRGEEVQPCAGLVLGGPILLIKLPFGVPTPWAYSQWQSARELPGIDYQPQRLEEMELVNDLERPVFQKHLVLALLKQTLRAQSGVRAALMSGSGSTVFAVLTEDADLASLTQTIHETVGSEVWIQPTRLAG